MSTLTLRKRGWGEVGESVQMGRGGGSKGGRREKKRQKENFLHLCGHELNKRHTSVVANTFSVLPRIH